MINLLLFRLLSSLRDTQHARYGWARIYGVAEIARYTTNNRELCLLHTSKLAFEPNKVLSRDGHKGQVKDN